MDYLAFLLRLWREEAHQPWRASLENPHTGERVFFADFDALVFYLTGRLEGTSQPEEEDYEE